MIILVAGVGRCPLAQVLRNSLSGHPPTTGLRDMDYYHKMLRR